MEVKGLYCDLRIGLGTVSPLQLLQVFFPGLKQLGRDVDHWPSSSNKVCNQNYIPLKSIVKSYRKWRFCSSYSLLGSLWMPVVNRLRQLYFLKKKSRVRHAWTEEWPKILSTQFSLLYCACWFSCFFNIPTHAHTIYTLKSTKILINP
jgi:hypothetical protein